MSYPNNSSGVVTASSMTQGTAVADSTIIRGSDICLPHYIIACSRNACLCGKGTKQLSLYLYGTKCREISFLCSCWPPHIYYFVYSSVHIGDVVYSICRFIELVIGADKFLSLAAAFAIMLLYLLLCISRKVPHPICFRQCTPC